MPQRAPSRTPPIATPRAVRTLEDVDAGAVGRPSFSTLQSSVALIAGLTSIVGAAYSAVSTFRPAPPAAAHVATVVRDATTAAPVTAAVVEVVTADDALVTTLHTVETGIARGIVTPGAYRVRILHPDFAPAQRDVQLAPDADVELRIALAPRPRPSAAHAATPRSRDAVAGSAVNAIDRGVAAGRRWLGRIGF
jgi:Carboxypeptidase regulatory-like domain